MDLVSAREIRPAAGAGGREEKKAAAEQHLLLLHDRKNGSLTGVREVISFDENQVVLDTEMGLLTVKGKDLHLSRLTLEKGEADLDGSVDSLVYSSNEAYRRSGESFFARLFK